jgi:hypothetical protein
MAITGVDLIVIRIGLNPASKPGFIPDGIPISMAHAKASKNPTRPRKMVIPKEERKSGFPTMLIRELMVSTGPGRIWRELKDLDSNSHPMIRIRTTIRLIIRFLVDEFFIR